MVMHTEESNYSCVAAEVVSIKTNKTGYSIRVFLNSTGNTLGKKCRVVTHTLRICLSP